MCFLKSSLGSKYLMALTGLALIGFVVAHLLGNLQMFAGPEAINAYAQTLVNLGGLLWIARIGLLVIFFTHLGIAVKLKMENNSARPVKYSFNSTVKATLTSRMMVLTGILILAFIIFHLMHYTLNIIDPSYATLVDAKGRHDVYSMVVSGFSNPYFCISYIIAILALGAHLHHGASSMFQTLGFNSPKYQPCTKWVGPALSLVITLGYLSIPVAVWLEVIQ
jgi:succinate dehydrogenase / fumarate reductase, cytochrome b subunit